VICRRPSSVSDKTSRLYLFTNGKFDLSDPVPHATTLLGIANDEEALGTSTPFTWMTITSWHDPVRTQRLLMRRDERERLWAGQRVVVLERQGFYGTRWISAIESARCGCGRGWATCTSCCRSSVSAPPSSAPD
jgi:hypothetical protein